METSWIRCLFLVATLLKATAGKTFATQMSPRVITTQYGKVRGVLVSLPNKKLPMVEAYLGLQYASILGKELRFMPPTSPLEKWDGIRIALKFRPVCPQKVPDISELQKRLPKGRVDHYKRILPFLEKQKEECLNLNIYVPVRASNETDLLPVLVFIHGESYDIGSGNAYDGSVLASFGKIIVVTLNYRLGAFGFLSTGDSNAAGNYALLDQVAALHWIKENIEQFGGNSAEVTLLGHGFGAAMVNLLLVSPVTKEKNLFKRAILQSGSASATWATVKYPLRYTKILAEKVNCSKFWGKSDRLIQCLKRANLSDLVNHNIQAPKYFSAFGPVIDYRSVLPRNVNQLMNEQSSVFGSTNVLLGVTRNEGFLYFTQREIDHGINATRKEQILRTYVRNAFEFHRQKVHDILLHHYSNHEKAEDATQMRDSVMELIGDGQYNAPFSQFLSAHSQSSANTYSYLFSYPSRLESYPRWAGGIHGDDLLYVFGAPLTDGLEPFPSTFTRSEKTLTEGVMRYWTNFIKTGNPNSLEKQGPVHNEKHKNRFKEVPWPKYDQRRQRYLHIGMRPTIRNHYRGNKMALWLELLPKLHNADGLAAKFHLLKNYQNTSTFEREGTAPLHIKSPFPLPPPQPPTPPPRRSTTLKTPRKSPPLAPPPPSSTAASTTTTEHYHVINPSKGVKIPPAPAPTNRTGKAAGHLSEENDKNGTLSLSVTIAVGCSLLFLNILIFAGVYYQKDRMRTELKEREAELQAKHNCIHHSNDCNYRKASAGGHDTDTNSSGITPPGGSSHRMHMYPRPHSMHENTGGGPAKPHPIPVLPPQAPSNLGYQTLGPHHRSAEHGAPPETRRLYTLARAPLHNPSPGRIGGGGNMVPGRPIDATIHACGGEPQTLKHSTSVDSDQNNSGNPVTMV